MTSIDDFSQQKDNLVEINTVINDFNEKISMMNMMGDLLPDLKNATLKKKVEKTVLLSTQGATLINQIDDLCSSSVDKFKKEYKELEKKINKQFQELTTEVTDKKWLT